MKDKEQPLDDKSPAKYNPYKALACAVVLNAMSDYNAALEGLKSEDEAIKARSSATVRECEYFFNSDWFDDLTGEKGNHERRKKARTRSRNALQKAHHKGPDA